VETLQEFFFETLPGSRFKKNPETWNYQATKGWFVELKKSEDGLFYLIYPDRTIENFDSVGRLIKIQDRNTNKMEFFMTSPVN
jgi:hypothetical protein